MKSDGKSSEGDSGAVPLEERPVRLCPVCHAPLKAGRVGEFCPICMLREGLREDVEDERESFGGSASGSPGHGFEHYELALTPEGTPVELGRGAMGITYKAFDLELRCPVALKVIGERYVGDEGARRRFLREARAAASVRHFNVASVFHLGRAGGNYFYAMEFVEGETLQRLIKRSGRVEVSQALEIASQVAAGLAAVHKQSLVHRDIKPANIMVSLEERGAGMVKIIDLGLAKAFNESLAETAISTPGAFAGTPEFASPEQILGLGVDIRSDLYSLGITLWEMVTGQVPFRGAPAEVLYQHQHKPLPTGQLEGVPQPVIMLLEVLLEKNSAHRFQTPTELLEALPAVKEAAFAGRRMMKTVRINVFFSGDVRKERNLAERLMHSIVAELDLPVSGSVWNRQRLIQVDPVFGNEGMQPDRPEQGNLIVCPCFCQFDEVEAESDRAVDSGTAESDLNICIAWSRLSPVPESLLKALAHPNVSLGATSTLGPELDNPSRNWGDPGWNIYRNCSNPTPPLEPKEEREEFGRQWDALQEFFATLESARGGNLSLSVYNYRSLEEFEEFFRKNFRSFLADRFGLAAGRNSTRGKLRRWRSSPFRGLNVFGFEHSPIFYGRTKAIGEVLEAIEVQAKAETPFVMVVGASGSGKSSLVQAGVLPLLTQPGTIEGIDLWRRAVTRPGAGGGGDCFDALAAALLESAGLPALQDPESINGTQDLARELRQHPDSVALRVRDSLDHAAREWKIEHRNQLEQEVRRLRAAGRLDEAGSMQQRADNIKLPKSRLALVVDQLEELFTTGFSPEVRQNYVSAVADLVRSGRVFVLATLRSDFYPSYQQFPQLIELTKPGGKIDLRPPTPYEIGEIIRLPAEAIGLRFEEEVKSGQHLDEALRDAASATPESLPLLEHVLSLLYEKQVIRGNGLLSWFDYREMGELKGALARHAETVFATLQPDEKGAFPLVMRYLVTLGQGEEEFPNRRTVPYRDFSAASQVEEQKTSAKGFVDSFIKERLLVADTDPQGEVTVSVAHEALLREWQRVRDWLTENREFLRMRDRLDSSLRVWASRGKQKDDLLGPGLPLAEAEKLLANFGPSLSPQQTNFVNTSIAEHKRRQRSQERLRYAVMTGIGMASIAAVIFGVVSFLQFKRAEAARDDAESLIDFMTIDLRDKLKPIGRLGLLDDVNVKVQSYYKSLVSEDNSPAVLRRRSIAQINYGDIQKERGHLAAAMESFSEALATEVFLVDLDPNNITWQRDLSVSLERIGDVLQTRGKISTALDSYQKSYKIREKYAKANPANVNLQLDLATSLTRIGDVLNEQGQSGKALDYYQRSLNIRKDLADAHEKDNELQLELSLGYAGFGDLLSTEGDSKLALDNYNLALKIKRNLVSIETANARYQYELAFCLAQIGYELASEGDLSNAMANYKESLSLYQTWVATDFSNTRWKRDYAICLERVGDIYKAQDNLTEAQTKYGEALSTREALIGIDKDNLLWQGDLSWSYQEIGDVFLAQRDCRKALEQYKKSLEVAKALSESDMESNEKLNDLAIIREKTGEALMGLGKYAQAREFFSAAVESYERLEEKKVENAQWAADEALAYFQYGMILERLDPASRDQTLKMLTLAQTIWSDLKRQSKLSASYENRLKEVEAALATL